jgi:hypothetical protein
MTKSFIILFFLLSHCYGQSNYFNLNQKQLLEAASRDGYRYVTFIVNDQIVYSLTNGWDSIRVAYNLNSELPSYIIYRKEE